MLLQAVFDRFGGGGVKLAGQVGDDGQLGSGDAEAVDDFAERHTCRGDDPGVEKAWLTGIIMA